MICCKKNKSKSTKYDKDRKKNLIIFGAFSLFFIIILCFSFKYIITKNSSNYSVQYDNVQKYIVLFVNLYCEFVSKFSLFFTGSSIIALVSGFLNFAHSAELGVYCKRLSSLFNLFLISMTKRKLEKYIFYTSLVLPSIIITFFFNKIREGMRIIFVSEYDRAFLYKILFIYIISVIFCAMYIIIKHFSAIRTFFSYLLQGNLYCDGNLPNFFNDSNKYYKMAESVFSNDNSVFSVQTKAKIVETIFDYDNAFSNIRRCEHLVSEIKDSACYKESIAEVLKCLFFSQSNKNCVKFVRYTEFVCCVLQNQIDDGNWSLIHRLLSIEDEFGLVDKEFATYIGSCLYSIFDIKCDNRIYVSFRLCLYKIARKGDFIFAPNKKYVKFTALYKYYKLKNSNKKYNIDKLMFKEICFGRGNS